MASLSSAINGSELVNSFLGLQTRMSTRHVQRSITLPHVSVKAATVSAQSSMASHEDASPAMSRREIFGLGAALAGATFLDFSTAKMAVAADSLREITTPQFQKLDSAARKFLKTVIAPLDAGVWVRLAFHDLGDLSSNDGGPNSSVLSQKELKNLPTNADFEGQNVVSLINIWQSEISNRAGIPISKADVIQLAGAVAVEITGGPAIPIPLGRPDRGAGTGVDISKNLYNPGMTYDQLKAGFTAKGLSTEDLVALVGAHTIGFFGAPSLTFRPNSNAIDKATPLKFDNTYFKTIQQKKAVFPSDNALITNPEGKSWVDKFAKDEQLFFKSFAKAYAKMSVVGLRM